MDILDSDVMLLQLLYFSLILIYVNTKCYIKAAPLLLDFLICTFLCYGLSVDFLKILYLATLLIVFVPVLMFCQHIVG